MLLRLQTGRKIEEKRFWNLLNVQNVQKEKVKVEKNKVEYILNKNIIEKITRAIRCIRKNSSPRMDSTIIKKLR